MIVNGNLTEVNQVVFVVGDVMLDKYIFGVVNRISPEAASARSRCEQKIGEARWRC